MRVHLGCVCSPSSGGMGLGYLAVLVLVFCVCVCVLSNAGLEPAGTLVPGSNPKEDDGPVQTPTERLHFMALGTGE